MKASKAVISPLGRARTEIGDLKCRGIFRASFGEHENGIGSLILKTGIVMDHEVETLCRRADIHDQYIIGKLRRCRTLGQACLRAVLEQLNLQ